MPNYIDSQEAQAADQGIFSLNFYSIYVGLCTWNVTSMMPSQVAQDTQAVQSQGALQDIFPAVKKTKEPMQL